MTVTRRSAQWLLVAPYLAAVATIIVTYGALALFVNPEYVEALFFFVGILAMPWSFLGEAELFAVFGGIALNALVLYMLGRFVLSRLVRDAAT